MNHNALLNWGMQPSDRYADGFHIGSEGENGEHLRDAWSWPYSIYKKATAPGVSDYVLCHGIQCMDDAIALCEMLNGKAVMPSAPDDPLDDFNYVGSRHHY